MLATSVFQQINRKSKVRKLRKAQQLLNSVQKKKGNIRSSSQKQHIFDILFVRIKFRQFPPGRIHVVKKKQKIGRKDQNLFLRSKNWLKSQKIQNSIFCSNSISWRKRSLKSDHFNMEFNYGKDHIWRKLFQCRKQVDFLKNSKLWEEKYRAQRTSAEMGFAPERS